MKLPEPTWFQYRWLNPANDPVHDSRLQWEDVTANWDESITEQCEELREYKHEGKPTYEVRGLYTEAQLKQAVSDALEAAAVVAWTHYLDTCKGNRIAPADNEKWLCATAIRKLKEGL